MKLKKAFTLAEISISIIIIGVICVIMIGALNPKKYDEKTNTASLMKTLEFISQASVQIMDMEDAKCPARSFMIKPAGSAAWEFAILNSSGSSASAQEVAELFGEHLKYESNIISFCDYTSYCSDSNIKGAKLPNGAYIGFEITSTVQDCPAYRMPYEETDTPAPTKYSKSTGTFETAKCWGKLYIDTNGLKSPDTLGQDVYVFGLGENGIEK